MTATLRIFGYGGCDRCQTPVLNEILYKTRGLCAECFRQSPIASTIIAVSAKGERVRLTTPRRSAGDRAQRKRAKARRDPARHRAVVLAQDRARARMARVFPEIYEVILADERAKLGLDAWTLERALTPHRVGPETFDLVVKYHALDQE